MARTAVTKTGAVPRTGSTWFHAHAHSHYSVLDSTLDVDLMVAQAVKYGDPALALTDHGNMAGFVKLYKACKAAGILPYAGVEGYMIDPMRDDWEAPAKGSPAVKRYHFGLLALNEAGYIALVKFVSMTHTRPRFSRFPRATFADLIKFGKEHGDNIAFTTGCYFGLIQQMIAQDKQEVAFRYLKMLRDVFPHLFVELQHHNICHDPLMSDAGKPIPMTDTGMVSKLRALAERLGLPVIATQDSHYLRMAHKTAHTLMKKMVYSSTEDGFPGDSFHLATSEWVADHYNQATWDMVEDGFSELLSLNRLAIKPLDDYKIHVPTVTNFPGLKIRKAVNRWLGEYLSVNPSYDRKVYRDRADT